MEKHNSLRKWIVASVFLFIGIAVAILYWPHSIDSAVSFAVADDICVTVIVADDQTPGDVQNESTEYLLEKGSPQYDRLLAILQKYTYHESFFTLGGDAKIENAGSTGGIYRTVVVTDSLFNIDLVFGDGKAANAILNRNVVRIGYWGDRAVNRLIDELLAVCGG